MTLTELSKLPIKEQKRIRFAFSAYNIAGFYSIGAVAFAALTLALVYLGLWLAAWWSLSFIGISLILVGYWTWLADKRIGGSIRSWALENPEIFFELTGRYP